MKIVTLCSCGLGTCFLLKMKLEAFLALHRQNAEVIPCDISSASLEQADLYIAPFGLDLDFASLDRSRVIVVEDILNAEQSFARIPELLEVSDYDPF